jgi:hypothetical protein
MNFGIGKVTSQVVDASVKRAGSGRNKDMGRIKSRIEIEIGGNGMKKNVGAGWFVMLSIFWLGSGFGCKRERYNRSKRRYGRSADQP